MLNIKSSNKKLWSWDIETWSDGVKYKFDFFEEEKILKIIFFWVDQFMIFTFNKILKIYNKILVCFWILDILNLLRNYNFQYDYNNWNE